MGQAGNLWTWIRVAFFLISFILIAATAKAYDHIEKAGDILQIAIPATAYGLTYGFNDRKGRDQLCASFFINLGITYALKAGVHKLRPNGGPYSFPSGHTSAAFCGAGFIHHRYGWKYGIPAYLSASFVGFSRVESFHHFPSDVAAGAAIGIFSSYLFTQPLNKNVQLVPVVTEDKYCLVLTYNW